MPHDSERYASAGTGPGGAGGAGDLLGPRNQAGVAVFPEERHENANEQKVC